MAACFAELLAGVGEEPATAAEDSHNQLLHKLLVMQTALLERSLASKPSDSVRGYAAREAFLQQLSQHRDVAAAVASNAARELGLLESQVAGNLMLEFVSRKIPLGEHRQLSYMATLFAHAWQDGHNEGNELLQSWASRGLMFCEQVALDSGRCQLGWMLTGLQPPDFHLLAQHKRRAHVQPFSTLAKPTWAAACLSYLKEMSYLEGRMNSLQGNPAPSQSTRDEHHEEESGSARRPYRRAKAKAKSGDTAGK